MNETQSDPSQESHLDLTLFAKSIFEGNDEYDLLKNPNNKSHFEPIPNQFYGFAIDLSDVCWRNNGVLVHDTIDIGYEDLTNQKLL